MDEQIVSKWLKAGYPYLKEGAGLPSWLLPQRSLEMAADELQDTGILRLSRPLKLASGIETVHDHMPDPSVFTAEAWQQAVSQCPSLSQVKAVVEAYLETADRVTAQLRRIGDRIDPAVIRRSFGVLLLAPLVPQGRRVTEEIAYILSGRADEPEQLMRGYARAVIDGDVATMESVDECIAGYRSWAKWAEKLERQTAAMKCHPKLIAVTPPPSSELAGVLTVMMKEGQQDESGRDYPQRAAS